MPQAVCAQAITGFPFVYINAFMGPELSRLMEYRFSECKVQRAASGTCAELTQSHHLSCLLSCRVCSEAGCLFYQPLPKPSCSPLWWTLMGYHVLTPSPPHTPPLLLVMRPSLEGLELTRVECISKRPSDHSSE